MEIRIKRVLVGTNEDSFPIMGPETQPPARYSECEITATEYVYTVPDSEEPAQ